MSRAKSWSVSLCWTAAAALLIDFGTIHAYHNADSLVPVLSSLYKWTFYYWEQNRFGMLVALIATPFAHPVTNLLVQNGMTIWFGLLCFPLAIRYLTGGHDRSGLGPFAAASFLGLAPGIFQWMFFSTDNVFSTSLALGLFGLVAVERPTIGRGILALGLMTLATWTNSAIGVMLLPLVFGVTAARWFTLDDDPEGSRRVFKVGLAQSALCLFALMLSKILERIPPPEYRTTWIVVPRPSDWPRLLMTTAGSFWAEQVPIAWACFFGLCAATGVALGVRRRDWRGLAGFVAVVVAAAVFVCVMGILFNGRWRYSVPALVLVHIAAVTLVGRSLRQTLASRETALLSAGLLAVLGAVVVGHGLPSRDNVTASLNARFGPMADAVRTARCTHLAGDYWDVWPVVFLANARAMDDGTDERVWGLTFRSSPTAFRWRAIPRERVRVAALAGGPEARGYLPLLETRLRIAERRDGFEVYVPE